MLSDRALRYAASLLGTRFLAYVANVGIDEMTARIDGGEEQLPGRSEQAMIESLQWALGWVPVPPEEPILVPDGNRPDGGPADRMRRFGWVDMDRGHSYANIVRLQAGGQLLSIPRDLDPAEEAIAWAALDYYPVTLTPVPRPDQPIREPPILSHARTEAFIDAIRADGSLAVLVDATETVWTSGSAFGFGAPDEARVLALIVASAEQRVRMFAEDTPEVFIEACVAGLRTVRRLCQGKDADVPELVGFSHVSLPEGTIVRGPRGGTLRPARDSDLRIPGTSPPKIVLETTHRLRMKISPMPPTDPKFYAGVAETDLDADMIALAGILATRKREVKGLPRETWKKTFDPLAPFTGSLKPEVGGLGEFPLEPAEAADLEAWIHRFEEHYHPSIRVAMKRCISGFAERQAYEDSVVDHVIALESLFGDIGGELRLRISAALAWLLGSGSDERGAIQKDAKRVYDIRSKIVHGSEVSGEDHEEARRLAQKLLLDAFERLIVDRPELVADRDRSLKLMMGA